jgi:hypothetical protein
VKKSLRVAIGGVALGVGLVDADGVGAPLGDDDVVLVEAGRALGDVGEAAGAVGEGGGLLTGGGDGEELAVGLRSRWYHWPPGQESRRMPPASTKPGGTKPMPPIELATPSGPRLGGARGGGLAPGSSWLRLLTGHSE